MEEMLVVFKSQCNRKKGGVSWTPDLSLDGLQCLQVRVFRLSDFYHHPSALQEGILCKDFVERAVEVNG